MREVLFSGKTTKKNFGHSFNEVWVEGDLITSKGKYFIHPKINAVSTSGEIGKAIVMHEVKPETIRQYTGLRDKNERKVFIGDIIRCTKGCAHEVVWLQEYAGTYVGGMPAIYLSGLDEGYAWTGMEEVIGNIFDNPELVEVGNGN